MLAILLAQTLGLMHGAVHGSTVQSANKTATLDLANVRVNLASDAQMVDQSWVTCIFPSHTSNADCRLYDQASHGSVLPSVAALALPVLLPSSAVAIFLGESLARWAALFEARGPPLTR